MPSRIYTVTDADGTRSLVRARSGIAAENFKRSAHVYTAKVATQSELVELVGVVAVEDAGGTTTAEEQA